MSEQRLAAGDLRLAEPRTSREVATTPYGGEELMEQARREAERLNLPESRREDAESEYVLGALEALQKDDQPGDIRAFQRQCGQNAMRMFLRREIRHERQSPRTCPRGAVRQSLNQLVPDGDGMLVPLSETLTDRQDNAPDGGLLRAEREEAVRRALSQLEPALADVAEKVLIEGMTQEDAAEALGFTRMMLRTRLNEARQYLQDALAAYRDDYRQTRQGKK